VPLTSSHQAHGVILGVDRVHLRIGPAHHLHRPHILADEIARDLDAMAAHVDDRAAAGDRLVPEPIAVRARVRFTAARPQHLAQRPALHRMKRLERFRRIHEVFQIPGEHPRLLDRFQHPFRFFRRATQRLGAQNGLARLRRQRHRFFMQIIGQPNHDHIRVRVVDGLLDAVRDFRNAPLVGKFLRLRQVARTDHPHPVTTVLVQRLRIEAANQAGAKHRDFMHENAPAKSKCLNIRTYEDSAKDGDCQKANRWPKND
jgi:hypothetical protein